jgi:murein L,D-transpeptidase YcbB/YkuD
MTVISMIRYFRNWRVCILTAMILVLPPSAISFAQEQASMTSTADALHAALVDRHSSMFSNGAPDPLFDFYASRNFAPAWTGPRNDVNLAAAVLSALGHADTQGLRVEDYSGTAKKWSEPPDAGPDAAAFELSLTTDLMRYAADVRLGKLNPAQVYHDVDLPARTFEFVAALNSALRTGNIDRFLADLPPQQPQYQGLIQALATYRMRQSNGGWPKMTGNGEVPLDGSNPRSHALISRLAQEDAQFAENSAPSVDDVRNALMSFQARNGIRADGRAGSQTLVALNVPVNVRIAQIIANLERWRWMQRSFEDKYILVNVPDQSVKLIENGQVSLESRAIVGRLGSKTPITRLLAGALVVNPPWHVPEDIAAAQILPKLRQNPNYLSDKHMVLANGPADDPQGHTLNWRKMKTMPYLIDQNPGPGSAMGEMMLDSPSNFGVYLHDTPGKALFQANPRLGSNGCIRVEDMLELSALVLGGDKENTKEQLRADIAAGQTQQVALETPVPIYLLYETAIAYSDGTVGFRTDVYGRDKPLLAALTAPVR